MVKPEKKGEGSINEGGKNMEIKGGEVGGIMKEEGQEGVRTKRKERDKKIRREG